MNSNQKGKAGERQAVKALHDHLGVEARRGVQYSGGGDSPDLVHSIPGVHFEVKRVEKLNLEMAMTQAREDGGEKIPVVMHRRNRTPWLVTVPLDRLRELAMRLMGAAVESDDQETR
jgi:Holliday junction resolvase